jgi:hypothetical protein
MSGASQDVVLLCSRTFKPKQRISVERLLRNPTVLIGGSAHCCVVRDLDMLVVIAAFATRI